VLTGRSRATFYRRHRPPLSAPPRRPPKPHKDRVQPRALSPEERARVLEVLNSQRFADASPAQVWATLLDEGVYLASWRTFYRVLAAAGQTGERRAQATHPSHVKPELLAQAPNRVWTWDITKIKGPSKHSYFYLYVPPAPRSSTAPADPSTIQPLDANTIILSRRRYDHLTPPMGGTAVGARSEGRYGDGRSPARSFSPAQSATVRMTEACQIWVWGSA
jgi:hypothetical protein